MRTSRKFKCPFSFALALGLQFCFLSFVSTVSAGDPLPQGYVLVSGDALLEKLTCPGGVRYRFTEKAVRDAKDRVIFSYVLNALLFGESREAMQAVNELLPNEEAQHSFLKVVFSTCDSQVWADGNAYAAYEILLMENFGDYGFSLASKAVLANAQSCRFERMDTVFIIQYIAAARHGADESLASIAKCALTTHTHYPLAFAAAVGFARIGRTEEADLLLKDIEKAASASEAVRELGGETHKMIRSMPKSRDKLFAALEKLLL